MTKRVRLNRIEAASNTAPPGTGQHGEIGLFLPTGAGKHHLWASDGTQWYQLTEDWPNYIDLSPHSGSANIGAAVTAFGVGNVPDSPVFANWAGGLYVLTDPAAPGTTGSWQLLLENSFTPTADFAGDMDTLTAGTYWCTAAATNGPAALAGTCIVAESLDTLKGHQLFMTTGGRTYQREKAAGTWSTTWTPLHDVDLKFKTIDDLLLSTVDYTDPDVAVGNIVRVTRDGYAYEIAASGATDHHVVNAGGLKMYVRGDVIKPQMVDSVGLLPGLGVPVSDEKAVVDKAIQIAAARGAEIDFGPYTYRYEGTMAFKIQTTGAIATAGDAVSTIRGNDCIIFQPTSSTFSQFFEDDGITPSNDLSVPAADRDATRVAVDMSGGPYNFEGKFTFKTVFIDRFRSDERALIPQDLACLGGVYEGTAEVNFNGQIRMEGYAYDRYVPKLTVGRSTRQFARMTGIMFTKFCLTEMGFAGNNTNGFDDQNLEKRVSRCGHFGTVYSSIIQSTQQVYGYLFVNGLTGLGATPDTETMTIDITHGSLTAKLSGNHPYLASGHYIAIPNAYQRSDGTMIDWVGLVDTKVGDTVTFSSKTRPYLPATGSITGASWYFRPPEVTLNYASLIVYGSMYFEGFRVGFRLMEQSLFSGKMDAKMGGAECCGLHGTLVQCDGFNNAIDIEANRQNDAVGVNLRAYVAYPMMYETDGGTDYDCPIRVHVRRMHPQNGTRQSYVATAVGVDPTYPVIIGSRTVDTARTYSNVFVETIYTDGRSEGTFAAGGELIERALVFDAGEY